MKKERPFSNGSDFDLWYDKNCDKCNISSDNINSDECICHIEEAMLIAYFDDGEIDKIIFDKIGRRDDLHLNNCPFKNAYKLKDFKINTTVFKHTQLHLF